jgi:hypothetical protein
MRRFIVYSNEGEILRTGVCQDSDLSLQAQVNETVMEGVALDHQDYIVDGVVTKRPSFDLQPSTLAVTVNQLLTINNIPLGTLVSHPDGQTIVDDGFISWSCAEPDRYPFTFTFTNFPYKPETLYATVTNA